ncbi:hypothetical protein POJ06DRAFT_108759 [Lipomyces tetrasporus]|uniref:RRN7-type domain-containing protein n=1 Tax=Lipomyces tetrasporus TaxID=54092 RepID=A0AAD7VTE0_9ASCO|nr:uncharacterized protein POJ06DRAFT_108759 [Lipomyces tetrasporus]KAJ8100629.1 hypothetical protein POJ06DRAFT_108759 [Lipomyces tetrasporus]
MGVEWRWGSVCGINNCRSQLWHTVDGLQYCQYGHQNEGVVELAEDEDDFQYTQGRIVRTKTRSSQNTSVKESRIYYGRKGYTLFLKCYQIHLRNQVAWLVKNKNAPPKLEATVKALWILYLEARGINALALHWENDAEDDHGGPMQGSSSAGVASSLESGPEKPLTSLPDHDIEMNRLIQDDELLSDDNEGLQDDSSIESSEDEETLDQLANLTLSGSQRASEFVQIRLPESVVLCYLGCRILKLPIFMCDLYRAARDMEFPFMRAWSIIPYSMRQHLDVRYQEIFEPRNFPLPGLFHNFCGYITGILRERHRLTVPPPSYTLLLFRYVHDLFLPLEIYQAVIHLVSFLSIDFSFQTKRKPRRGDFHPEIKLIVLVIVATKLCFGLDGVLRVPMTFSEQAAQHLNWDLWKQSLLSAWIKEDWEKIDKTTLNATEIGNFSEKTTKANSGDKLGLYEYDHDDIAFWDGDQINKFLDLYQKTWVVRDEEERREMLAPRQFLDLFPLPVLQHDSMHIDNTQVDNKNILYSDNDSDIFEVPEDTSVGAILRSVQASTHPYPCIVTDVREPTIPGELYAIHNIYRGMPEITSEYNELTQVFYVACSKIAGCSAIQLRRALKFVENMCASAVK